MALYGSLQRFFQRFFKTNKVKRPIQYPQLFSSKTETIQVWLCHFMAYFKNKLSYDPYYKQPMKILNGKMIKRLNPNYELVIGNPKFYMDNNSLMLKPKVKTSNLFETVKILEMRPKPKIIEIIVDLRSTRIKKITKRARFWNFSISWVIVDDSSTLNILKSFEKFQS